LEEGRQRIAVNGLEALPEVVQRDGLVAGVREELLESREELREIQGTVTYYFLDIGCVWGVG